MLVRWYRSPEMGAESETAYLTEVTAILNEATEPVFFMSDLRRGSIGNARILKELGKLASHKWLGGSTAFANDPVTELMINVFSQFAKRVRFQTNNETWDTPEEAIAYLETLSPGLTQDIEWDTVINKK